MKPLTSELYLRRFLKIAAVFALVIAVVVLGSHIWFVTNAKGVLKEVVSENSRGKLKLDLSELHFNIITNKGSIGKARITSTDNVNEPITYEVQFRKLNFRLQSFWRLILHKEFLLDSITLHDPNINVVQWREDTSGKYSDPNLSLPQEMGKVYHSMMDGFAELDISRIIINNAKLTLLDKTVQGSKPVTVSNIFFEFSRKHRQHKDPAEFQKTIENVSLRSSNQQILFPDGRHRLTFKKFNLQLSHKRIELDSCTISVAPTADSKSSYTIFFHKLMLVGADFDALYRHNLIRADSVYSESPFFDIRLDASPQNAIANQEKEKPDLEKMVRELTGDLDLQFVGMKHAGIHLEIVGKKKRSLLNSSKDNFEIRGFRIKPDSSKPVSIERFDMLVRDYQLYNADSSTVFSFDSIHFVNNRLRLNNFSVMTRAGLDNQRNRRDIRIPYFELTELDWYELFFEQNLKAKEAILFNPVIHFTKTNAKAGNRKFSFFEMLHTVDSLMTLNKVKIMNGQLKMELGPRVSFEVQDLNLALNSNNLMRSTDRQDIRNSVDSLSFLKGQLRFRHLNFLLENLRFSGENVLYCRRMILNSKSKDVQAVFSNVYLQNPVLGEQVEVISVDGMRWESGTLRLDSSSFIPSPSPNNKQDLFLKAVAGKNTTVSIHYPKFTISTFIPLLSIGALTKKENESLHVEDLSLRGNELLMLSGDTKLSATGYALESGGASSISHLVFERRRAEDTLVGKAPQLRWTADINRLLNKEFDIAGIHLQNPDIHFRQGKKVNKPLENTAQKITVGTVTAHQPVLNIRLNKNDSLVDIQLPASDKSLVEISGFQIDSGTMRAGSLALHTSSFSYNHAGKNRFAVSNGDVQVKLSSLYVGDEGGKSWSASLDRLTLRQPGNFSVESGAGKVSLDHVDLGNVGLSSGQPMNFKKMLASNLSAWINTGNGKYVDSNKTICWYNADYRAADRSITLDSFRYSPNRPVQEVLESSGYQTDYLTLSSGPLKITGFDPVTYEKDSVINMDHATISQPVLTVYRDKKPPFRSGIIKPLPVDMIRRLELPVSVKRIQVIDGLVSYTEKHAKTRADGTVQLTRLNGSISRLKNFDIDQEDSLGIQLTSYLMDTAMVDLRLKQSYTDSLHGFILTMRMKPTNVAFLNPVLAPMANIRIVSGVIDSFHLRAIGREHLAFGELNLFYRDLKVRLIKDGDPSKSTFMQKLGTIALNAFFVKTNNYGKKGIIYFERVKDRSFFNYLIKMTLSGIASSVGVKKNRKYLKQYSRELQERNLPSIPVY